MKSFNHFAQLVGKLPEPYRDFKIMGFLYIPDQYARTRTGNPQYERLPLYPKTIVFVHPDDWYEVRKAPGKGWTDRGRFGRLWQDTVRHSVSDEDLSEVGEWWFVKWRPRYDLPFDWEWANERMILNKKCRRWHEELIHKNTHTHAGSPNGA